MSLRRRSISLAALRESGFGPSGIAIVLVVLLALAYLAFRSALNLPAPDELAAAIIREPFVAGVTLLVAISILGAVLGRGQYMAGVRFVAPGTPAIAAATTLIAYVLPAPLNRDAQTSVALGLASALGLLGVGGILAIPFATARSERSRAYLEIRQRTLILQSRLAALSPKLADPDAPAPNRTAYVEASQVVEILLKRLDEWAESPTRGIGPVGDEYVGFWKLVHRAEEAMFMLEPTRDVVAQAVFDRQRLTGSSIRNAQSLLQLQLTALEVLDPTAQKTYFETRS